MWMRREVRSVHCIREDERGNRFVTDTDKENGTDFGRKAVDQETAAATACDTAAMEAQSEKAVPRTYAQQLSNLTGYQMATGLGLTTHYYNLKIIWCQSSGDILYDS